MGQQTGSQQSLSPGHSLGEWESSVKNNIVNPKGLPRPVLGGEVCPSGKPEVLSTSNIMPCGCVKNKSAPLGSQRTSQRWEHSQLPQMVLTTEETHLAPTRLPCVQKAPIPHPQQSSVGTFLAALQKRLNNPGTPHVRDKNAQTPFVGEKIIWRKVIPLVYYLSS